jgi:dTDP-4-amino-4,6-dideoxygalactose transaminase
VNPVSYENGTQVFIDSERDTWNMNPKALRKAFEKYNGIDNPKPTAVVLAHLYGTPAKIDEIREICGAQNVPLIEDAAESLGATYKGVQTGNFGNWAAISFNGNKIITSSGGGMFLSNDNESAKKVRFWCTQSREPYPWYQHEIYEYYKQGLSELPVELNPYDEANSQPNFWLSCMTINKGVDVKPMTVIDTLKEYNAEARPIWKPMHMQPLYKNNDFITVDNDNVGEDIFARGLCLPSDIKMTREEQAKVIEIIKSCFK